MAGRPRRQAMIAELERRTRDEFDEQPDATSLDYVEMFLASGHTLKQLADDVASATWPADDPDHKTPWSISGEMIRRYLETAFGADATETRLSRARARSTYGFVDEAMSIAEGTIPEAGFVAQSRLRVQTRQWMAERFNPSTFGQSKQPTVSISIAQLHLDALRVHGANPNEVTSGVIRAISGDSGTEGAQCQVSLQQQVSTP